MKTEHVNKEFPRPKHEHLTMKNKLCKVCLAWINVSFLDMVVKNESNENGMVFVNVVVFMDFFIHLNDLFPFLFALVYSLYL